MAEYCSLCSPFEGKCDIDLMKIALKLERGHSTNFLCEGCNVRAIYKDDSGLLYLAKEEGNEIKLEPIHIEDLISK